MGVFKKDRNSKEIILCHAQNSPTSTDLYGRKVNNTGYLLDDRGNIVDREGNVVWKSY